MEPDGPDARTVERYFVDPELGEEGVLQPPCHGIACRNLRSVLMWLGYELEPGNQYNDELAKAVLEFQRERGHTSRDGVFGPGTRRLLVSTLLTEFPSTVFQRLQEPVPAGQLFISYLREDASRIAQYLDALADGGFQVWYDKEIPGGTSWAQVIEEAVSKSDVVLTFLSRGATASKWVLREVQFADDRNMPIIAVRLDPVELTHGWGVLLSGSQILDASAPDFLPELKRAIEHTVRESRLS